MTTQMDILNLTTADQKKIGAIMIGMTVGVPVFGTLFNMAGLIDQPPTSSFLSFVTVFAFIYSLLMVAFYISIKDKVP